MSSIAQELDATLEGLEPSAAAALASKVREAMSQVSGKTTGAKVNANLQAWQRRLTARSAQLATGKSGASLQQVMDDLRS